MTKGPIAERAEKAKLESLNSVVNSDYSIDMEKLISVDYSSVVNDITINEAYELKNKDNKFAGLVILVTTSEGYGGDIQLSVGISTESNKSYKPKVMGIDYLSINETPGLGMNATDEEFTSQFNGATDMLTVVKQGAGGNQIDAVSGATITSQAVTDAVNEALEFYNDYVETEVE